MNILGDLEQIARTRPEQLKERKKNGAKLIGYTGRAVPEELILASGAVPHLICRGGEPEAVDATIPYLLRFMSPYYRAQIGYHLQGIDPVMPMFDLIVLQASDCQESRVADIFDYLKLPATRLGVPSDWKKPIALGYYKKHLMLLKEKLENITGNSINKDNLKQAIETKNELRDILCKISHLRKTQPPPISGYDYIRLNHYSFHCDPDLAVSRLTDLYRGLREKKSPFFADAPRILLAGHAVAIGDYAIPKLIEEYGGVIVAEMLDEGMQHGTWKVDIDGDPIDNLASTYYLERIPPSAFQPSWTMRADAMKKMVNEYNIDGVVLYEMSFEEIHNMEAPIFAKAMDEINIPFLRIESSYEYSREAIGPITTRIESFIESTRQKRGR